jgi:hypothetical protein
MPLNVYLTRLRELFMKTETTFNADVFNGNPASTYRLDAEDINFSPTQEFLERTVQLGTLGNISGLVGGKGGTVKFKLGLRSTGNTTSPHAVDTALATALSGSAMQRFALAGTTGQADTTAATGGTLSTTAVKLSADTSYGPGNAAPPILARLASGTTGVLEPRAIPASASGAQQTIAPPFTAAPSSADPILGADVWWPINDASGIISTPRTVTIKAYADNANNGGVEYTFTGCFGAPPKLTCGANKRAMLEFSFDVTSWLVTSTTAPAPDQVSAVPGSIVGLGASFWWKAAASSVTPISSLELDWGMALKPIASMTAPDGKAGWVPEGLKPILKVDPYFATSWQTDFSAATEDLVLAYMGGPTPAQGSTVAILLPSAQISKFPAPEDIGGLQGHKIEFQGNVPFSSADDSPGAVALGLAPAYLAFF